jgi:hypothetical protein
VPRGRTVAWIGPRRTLWCGSRSSSSGSGSFGFISRGKCPGFRKLRRSGGR